MTDDLILLPQPQKLDRLDGKCPLASGRLIWLSGGDRDPLMDIGAILQDAIAIAGADWELTASPGDSRTPLGAVVQIDPGQVVRPQGYRLLITHDQVRIVAHDTAGAFYGALTLRQIAEQWPGRKALPCLRIDDWPDFPHRGVMLDISRDKVPTMETLTDLIDLLATFKINQIQLYTEHTFAYRNHHDVWQDASPMTGEQIMDLDRYCRERHIELVPNQNSFGHFERWIQHDRYRALAEGDLTPHPDIPNTPNHCTTLCTQDPACIDLLGELYDELLPHFTSRVFNVGCDEPWELGKGRSKAAAEAQGIGRVYLDFLLKIHQLCQQRGHTMQFWGDIIINHPELIGELPTGIIAMEWGYEANHPFAEDTRRFAEAGVPFYVCPGTSSWCSIAGRTDNAVANLLSAAEAGRTNGAIGYLITDWGDNGFWQNLPVSYPGFAYGAAVAWAAGANRALDLPRALDLFVFEDAAEIIGRLVCDLGNTYRQYEEKNRNMTSLWLMVGNPQWSRATEALEWLTAGDFDRCLSHIDKVMEALPEAQMVRSDALLVAEELENNAALLRHACRLGKARLAAEGHAIEAIPETTRQELAGDLETIITEHKRIWLLRNRPGGLAESVERFENLLGLYRG